MASACSGERDGTGTDDGGSHDGERIGNAMTLMNDEWIVPSPVDSRDRRSRRWPGIRPIST